MYDDEPRRVSILTIVALVIALAALGLAGWTFYKTEFSKTEYDATQIGDAKTKICGAMDVVRRGVSLNTNMAPAGGPQDVTGAQAVAANARVSLYDGGQYLLTRLDPATPAQLADKVREFANGLMDIGAHATAGETNNEPAQAARLKSADDANNTITELCK